MLTSLTSQLILDDFQKYPGKMCRKAGVHAELKLGNLNGVKTWGELKVEWTLKIMESWEWGTKK